MSRWRLLVITNIKRLNMHRVLVVPIRVIAGRAVHGRAARVLHNGLQPRQEAAPEIPTHSQHSGEYHGWVHIPWRGGLSSLSRLGFRYSPTLCFSRFSQSLKYLGGEGGGVQSPNFYSNAFIKSFTNHTINLTLIVILRVLEFRMTGDNHSLSSQRSPQITYIWRFTRIFDKRYFL